jgi:hypothetical protein
MAGSACEGESQSIDAEFQGIEPKPRRRVCDARSVHSAIVGFPTSKPVIVHLPRNERLDARYYSLFDGPHRQPSIDKTGALLIADDVGNTVWRVSSQ